jgi:tetratricopeptide (TPR) repeat protein
VLAHHYSKSQNLEKAYHYLRLSGDKASRSYSNWEAFRFYEEAIGVLNRFPDSEENTRNKIEVRLLMEGPMRLLGFPGDSLSILQEGEKLSKEIGDEKSLAIFYSILGFYFSVRGDASLGRKYSENGFQEAMKVEDIDLAAPIAFDLCAAYNISGEFKKLVKVAPKVLALLEKTKRESEFFSRPFNFNLYSAICSYYGRSMGWLGDFQEGQVYCEKALRFARETNNIYSIGWAEFMCGFFFNTHGDGRKAIDHFERSIKYLEEGQLFLILGLAWAGLGWGYYFAGDLDTAREYTEKGIKIHTDVGNPVLLSQLYLYLGMAQLDSSDVPMALKSIEQALDLSLARNEKYSEGIAKILLGRAYGKGEKPQYEQAKEHILNGIRIVEELGMKPYFSVGHLFLGELLADAGCYEESLEHLVMAEKLFGEMGMEYWSGRTQDVLASIHR